MPIEIKEITIRANIYPDRQAGDAQQLQLSAAELEKLKQELKKEILADLKQQWQQQKFER